MLNYNNVMKDCQNRHSNEKNIMKKTFKNPGMN